MSKSSKIYIFILVLLLVGKVFLDANKPKPIDWTPTYGIKDKIPFGLYVLNNEMDGLFKDQKITKFGVTPYEFLDPTYTYVDSTYSINGTILYVNEDCIIDDESAQELLYFASHGNTVFISATNFPDKFRDTLGFNFASSAIFTDSLQFTVNKKEKYRFLEGTHNVYFTELDSSKVEILGYQSNTPKDSVVNFIRVPHANGEFFFHTQPIVFTNFHLLNKNKHKYAEDVLSYINDDNIFWYLEGTRNKINSKLGYIHSQPALQWAWYISLLSILIFIIFNAKRKQRIIPIKEPLKNTTVDFTKTIGNLYFQVGNHQDILEKKIKFFLEKVRNEYFIDTFDLNENFILRLHQKTGKSKTEIENLVRLIKKYNNQIESSEKDLVEFNDALEKLTI